MMSASQNDMIAAEFLRIAAELDDEGANPYRIRAYRRAAGIIARLMEDAGALALRGELTKISGIGEDLAGKVAAFYQKGRIEVGAIEPGQLPAEIAAWVNLPGLNAAIVRHLYQRLHIRTLDDLEALTRSRLLRTLPELTVSEDEILDGIARLRAGSLT